jgi:hypothetical protein
MIKIIILSYRNLAKSKISCFAKELKKILEKKISIVAFLMNIIVTSISKLT